MTWKRLARVLALWLVAGVGCASHERLSAARSAPNDVLAVPCPRPRAVEDYRLGAGDVLAVAVYELERPGEFLKLDAEVSSRGEIVVPFLGVVGVESLTTDQVRKLLRTDLARGLLLDPQVTVQVKEYRSVRVSVSGAVARPGVLYLDRNRVSLLDALSLAGGLSREAGTTAIVVRPAARPNEPARGGFERIEVDLVELLSRAAPGEAEPYLLPPGSTVHVPEAREFFVGGYVNRPGAFPYRRPTTVLQAVALAGGLDARRASASAVRVMRPRATGAEVIEVDLDAIVAGEAPDVAVLPGDSVEVGRTTAWAIVSETLDALRGFVGMSVSAARFP